MTKSIVYIHRGRNYRSTEIGKWFTNTDYNFDFRGKSKLSLLLKAFITSREVAKADYYLVEGGLCLNVAYFVKLFKARKSKIILMVPEPFFDLGGMSKFKKAYIKMMLKKVDGIMPISEMVRDDAREVYNGNIEITNYYVGNQEYFLSITPNLKAHSMVFMCERPLEAGYIKGLDIVIEAFKLVKEKIPDAELYIMGSGTDRLKYDTDGIHCLGFADIKEIFSKCSIMFTPARYDAFLMAQSEACTAGLVPVISYKVGAQEYIKKVDNSLVIQSFNPEDYAKKIIELWKGDLKIMEKISAGVKKQVSTLTKENVKIAFINAFNKLVGEKVV